MIRKAFVMSVNEDAYAEYEKRHNPIWPELEAVLKGHGVSNYSIFLDETSGCLFGYVEVESEERWNAIAATPECRRWWAHMAELMPSREDNRPVSFPLREVFHMD